MKYNDVRVGETLSINGRLFTVEGYGMNDDLWVKSSKVCRFTKEMLDMYDLETTDEGYHMVKKETKE